METNKVEKLKIFLDNVTTENNISILSALFNISNYDLYTELMDLLVDGKVSLLSIANLDIIDDTSIENFIRNYKNKLNPVVGLLNPTGNFNAYTYLLEKYNHLNGFIQEYNTWQNNNINLVNNFNATRIAIPYITYSAQDGSVYSSKQDFIMNFNNSVLPLLLSKFNTTDINTVIPKYTVSGTLASYETQILNNLWSFIYASFSNLNNSSAYRFVVELPDDTSFLREYFIPLHGIINYIPYTGNIDNLLVYNIQFLANKNSGFSSTDITNIQNNLLDISTNPILSLSDKISFIKFYAYLINQYKANNSIAVSTVFINELNKIINKIEELKVFFNIMYTYTIENMYLLG